MGMRFGDVLDDSYGAREMQIPAVICIHTILSRRTLHVRTSAYAEDINTTIN